MKIYLFGIGNNFIRAYRWLAMHFEIVGLIDNSVLVRGKKICSFVVQDSSVLFTHEYDKVVITVNRSNEIVDELKAAGLSLDKIVTLHSLLYEIDHSICEDSLSDKTDEDKKCDRVRLGIIMGGGAGNKFVQMNFIHCLKQYLFEEPIVFVVFGDRSKELNRLLMERIDFIEEYHQPNETEYFYTCDVLVQLEFYPHVLLPFGKWIEKIAPKLTEVLCMWWHFMDNADRIRNLLLPQKNRKVYEECIAQGLQVLTSYDIDGRLGIEKKYRWKLELANENGILEKLGLVSQKYITLQRGAAPSLIAESTKLWPKYHFEKLIRLLKISFPDKKVVQLGQIDNSEVIEGIDVNLLGKTSWEELGIVLKNAFLHIDGECGMVHYRAAMQAGASVVLFGPTPIEFYGYPGNINIRSDDCPQFCARLTETWQEQCVRGYTLPICMGTITPEMVMERIEEYCDLRKG